jgi:hypothetical protein
MNHVPVFFYGLFMDIGLLRSKGLDPQNPRLAQLPGYQIRIGNRATVVLAQNMSVYGILVDLTRQEINRLYSRKSLKGYRAEPVIVLIEGTQRLAALCYNLAEPPLPQERNEKYAKKLRAVALQCGLPEEYVHTID